MYKRVFLLFSLLPLLILGNPEGEPELIDIAVKNVDGTTEVVFTLTDYPNIAEQYIDKIIPLRYGLIKSSEAYPIDGETGVGNDVTFRQALLLTSLGTVQVKIDEVWTTTGIDFVLSSLRRRLNTSRPSILGIFKSIRITWGITLMSRPA